MTARYTGASLAKKTIFAKHYKALKYPVYALVTSIVDTQEENQAISRHFHRRCYTLNSCCSLPIRFLRIDCLVHAVSFPNSIVRESPRQQPQVVDVPGRFHRVREAETRRAG